MAARASFRARVSGVLISALIISQGLAAGARAAEAAGSPSSAVSPSPSRSAKPAQGPSASPSAPIEPTRGTTDAAATVTSSAFDPATELVDRRTATSRSFRNTDGTVSTEIFSQAIHYQPAGSTAWEPIDLTFAPTAAGSKSATIDKSPTKVTVAPANDATGFLAIQLGGQQIALRPATPSTSSVAPTLAGAEADVPDISPGVDLRVFASADGVNAFLVLKSAPASPSFTFIVDAPTLSLSLDKTTKRLLFKNAQNLQVGSFLNPYAVDSTPDDLTGSGRVTTAVSYALGKIGGKPAVTVSIDPTWLAGATYPVYVDPTIYNDGSNTYGDAHVNQGNASFNYANYKRPDSPGYYEMWLGESPSDPTYYNEDYIKFDLSSIARYNDRLGLDRSSALPPVLQRADRDEHLAPQGHRQLDGECDHLEQ